MELTSENEQLRGDIVRLNNQLNKKQPNQRRTESLQRALSNLEEQVRKERTHSHHQLRCLKEEKARLAIQVMV